ncbi:MAG TPA: hypothetical protein IAC01_05585 [Candidatus Limicola stercorigallinarum]|nr:hypothetical protein [Candidatus Limicola stercorigallinarum]
MSGASTEFAWVKALCLQSESTCPSEVLEELMAAPECPAFGPVHHMLTGAALLASAANAGFEMDLGSQLDELAERASCVPGGSCARWGVCGAAASCGMALAIVQGNAPLKPEGWSETQLMVADLLEKIAHAGAPRCCKRDARIAVREATPWFSRALGVELPLADSDSVCVISGQNTACIGGACPYHP